MKYIMIIILLKKVRIKSLAIYLRAKQLRVYNCAIITTL